MFWLHYVLVSALIFGIGDIIYKSIDYSIINIYLYTALWAFCIGILSFIYLLYSYNKNYKIINNIPNSYYLLALFHAAIFFIGYLLYFYSLKICYNPELVRTIFSGGTILVLIFYSIYKSTILNFHQYIGILFILIGMFLAYNKNII